MNIKISQQQDVTLITLSGEIHRQTAPMIQEEITPLVIPDCKILVDMRDVTYMSSAGLRLMLLFYRQVETQNGRIALTGLQEMVRDTMSITGFLEFFAVYDTIEEGIASLKN
ncbi:MAG: anti-sigma factor antagonist [Chloroflexota bacterium]